MMPAPVFYVFYLGKPDALEVETFRLSDHYKENAPENSIEEPGRKEGFLGRLLK